MTWILDLDGVVWLGDQSIPGSAEAVARLRAAGQRVVLVTNNSSMTVGAYLAKLQHAGVPSDPADLVTSAQVAAGLLRPGERALVLAGPGVFEALDAHGVTAIPSEAADGAAVDAVVVGWHREFDYERLTRGMQAVRRGARLIGTNDDATYPTPQGLIAGGGSILAAVAYASGVTPVVAGKPNATMVEHVRRTIGAVDILVGDRPDTDGLMARRLGCPFALVLSGVATAEDAAHLDPAPDLVAANLAEVVAQRLGR
jgi:glycerol 3-phosphatase-2